MVFLRASDYHNENKKFKRSSKVMKKIKLPTDLKTKKCSISLCPYPSVLRIKIGLESRNLCKKHLDQHINKNEKHVVIFTKSISWF